jgi:hypothetical protein
MEETGAKLVEAGYTVVSGNAPGADQAWARGGNRVDPSRVELCLPWEGFESVAIHGRNIVRVIKPADERYFAAVKNTHPAFGHLTVAALNLHARNAMIVDGAHLVLGSLNPLKRNGGGTGGAFRVAQRWGIVTKNVCDTFVRQDIETRLATAQDIRGMVYDTKTWGLPR